MMNKKLKKYQTVPADFDKPHCNCGIVGVFNHEDASVQAYYALHALQHRGQEAAGITTFYDDDQDRKRFAYTRGMGLVLDVFTPETLTEVLHGDMAIAHNRYSTTGSSNRANIQPFQMRYNSGILSVAHNGNLTNTKTLWKKLQDDGAIFQTTSDSELFLHLIARSKKTTVIDKVREALQIARGAYSVVILTEDSLIAARDPRGFRPLNIGKKKNAKGEDAYFVASETCSFDMLDAEYVRSVNHNEIVVINRDTVETGEMQSLKIDEDTPEARHCIFEYVYFSRPDSKIFGHNVDKVRRKLGKNLAVESPVITTEKEGKVTVVPVPDSGNTATLGFSRMNQKHHDQDTVFEIGFIRSHYVGRTFIAPGQDNRELKVKVKFNTVKGVLENRNVVVIDDSIVRGTTSKSLINLVKKAGPKVVHFRITSPQIKFPCHYGMDFPSKEELIANHYNSEKEIADAIGVDTLHYLSMEALLESVPNDVGLGYCTACFDGIYPVPIDKDLDKFAQE
ncbi:MAG: amidophosphoribosyltransferase [Candidatus Kapabacteria bacterium]|jgi:amidophosphoribosyltransferase|nr:amidophosphoribosyltransferase [Candidatus Kapabacteria bacterium]